jgi:hypothetical protein
MGCEMNLTTEIVTVEEILKNGGSCAGLSCQDCPAERIAKTKHCLECSGLWNTQKDKKIEWFENWLKTNKPIEKLMFEKEQFQFFLRACVPVGYQRYVENAVEEFGFIEKNPVEIWDEKIRKYKFDSVGPNLGTDEKELLMQAIETIRYLKENQK